LRTRIKICGITRPEDAVTAARLGADAIGLVFYTPSPRAVTLLQARAIAAVLPPFVSIVALFVDADARAVRAALESLPIGLLQFHGDEPPEACRAYGRPYIKALPMADGIDVHAQAERYADAAGLLLDTWHPKLRGGSGEPFDWARVPRRLHLPVILAGGLRPENVAAAVAQARPYGVDVSSGVESAKGIKDAARMAAFIRGVHSVDAE
jgi:phosphoribosylanthranilate isomerase